MRLALLPPARALVPASADAAAVAGTRARRAGGDALRVGARAARPHGRGARHAADRFERYPHRERSGPRSARSWRSRAAPGSRPPTAATTTWRSRPAADRRDLLLVDLRGTGLSGALDCPALRQHGRATTCARAGRCAAQLGPRATSTARTRWSTTSRPCSTRCGIRQGRPLRRLLRLLRRAGVRGAPPAIGCARSCSTAPIRCPAPTRRSATSPRRRSARCGWCARGGRPARRAARTRWRSSARLVPRCARTRQRLRPEHRGRARARAARRGRAGVAGPVRLREPADVPRPARGDPRLRGRRSRAAAAAVRGEQARHRGVRGARASRRRTTSR